MFCGNFGEFSDLIRYTLYKTDNTFNNVDKSIIFDKNTPKALEIYRYEIEPFTHDIG